MFKPFLNCISLKQKFIESVTVRMSSILQWLIRDTVVKAKERKMSEGRKLLHTVANKILEEVANKG